MNQFYKSQLNFFNSNKTLDIDFRISKLRELEQAIQDSEQDLIRALHDDLKKPETEAYATEVGYVLHELRHIIQNLKSWAKPKSVSSSVVSFPSQNKIYSVPRGVVLVISPWNFPFQLAVSPMVGALSAGNCVTIKPSEFTTYTNKVIVKIIKKVFEPEYVNVIEGGVQETTELLKLNWDHIFYTGSTEVGKVIMRAASEHLTPVTLELGGKSPCIVDASADLDVTANRIVWGKFLNAGQVCVAPDYLIVNEKIKPQLIEKLKAVILDQFGLNPKDSPDLGRVINARHFDRVLNLIEPHQKVHGGRSDKESLYIEPTLLDQVNVDDLVMQSEIFGPLLPILSFSDEGDQFENIKKIIEKNPNPLAFYVFTKNEEFESRLLREVRFGGGCVNDCVLHVGNVKLPFGGVRQSGIGAYHARYSFDLFSHQKSILKRSFWPDFKVRYRPYKKYLNIIKKLT